MPYVLLLLFPLTLGQVSDQRIVNVDYHVKLIANFFAGVVPKADLENGKYLFSPYNDIRFLSFLGVPDDQLEDFRLTMWWWLQQLSFSPDFAIPKEVPGGNGRLYFFHLSDYYWNPPAFSAVARREPYFREPFINNKEAEYIRRIINIPQDSKSLHAEAVVRADWLFRETAETVRSTSYYDLLFAKFRFKDDVVTKEKVKEERHWPGGDYQGKYYAPGKYSFDVWKEKRVPGGFVDFPKNEEDWNKAFGIDVIEKFAGNFKFESFNGAVILGHTDDPARGSIVAQNNRLLRRLRTLWGAGWKTFDVLETSGRKDFSERLNIDFDHDASEYISNLPNGGQAYLLTDGKGKRLETADNAVATDRADTRDLRVRTPGSCVICHEQGIIRPHNIFEEDLVDGIDVKFKDPVQARNIRAFFLNWDHKVTEDQATYTRGIVEITLRKAPGNATAFKKFRDWYDAPLDSTQAAREMGVPTDVLKILAVKSPHTRPLQLLQGKKIPRRTWEVDTYKELMLALNARTPLKDAKR